MRTFELLPQLVNQGVIKGFGFKDLTPHEMTLATEMFGLGGHARPVNTGRALRRYNLSSFTQHELQRFTNGRSPMLCGCAATVPRM